MLASYIAIRPAFIRPSSSDHEYSERILEHLRILDCLWLPIIQTVPDTGRFEVFPYASMRMSVAGNRAKIEAARLKVVPDVAIRSLLQTTEADSLPSNSRSKIQPVPDQRFDRLSKGFDLKRHAATRLVVVGTGGSASFLSNCARMGFEDFVLIDPDSLVAPNIATQQANPDRIGTPKVEALAEQILKINPRASVKPLVSRIEDLDDSEFADLLSPSRKSWHPSPRTILLTLTDNFHAQARGHRLGLHFGVPTICAQEYREGRGAEITYTVPGVTPACHRCITSSRYSQYLENGFTNDVTSESAPIFAAEFLNAVIGHVLLAIVYNGTEHPRFGGIIKQLGNRNLIQMRMDPQFEFARDLGGARDDETSVMFDSAFLAQTPDCGQTPSRRPCPDCKGSGNLLDVIGKFTDTRIMRLPELQR